MKNDLLDLELQGITENLVLLDVFTGVIQNEIMDASDSERTVEFADTLLSCLSMQTAKIKELIATTEKLADTLQKTQSTD